MWEYAVLTYDEVEALGVDNNFENGLNEMGLLGWELIMSNRSAGLIFKRPKPVQVKR